MESVETVVADEKNGRPPLIGRATAILVTALLVASVAIYGGYHAWIAFDPDDTNNLETTLALATARQLADGPSTFYGPFSGTNPLVLIHAPLYYRLIGSVAWVACQFRADPMLATLASGRAVSALGLLAIALSAAILANGPGGTRLAGFWAALLILGSPVFGSFGFTIRPDTLGIALQTAGLALAARGMGLLGAPDDRRGLAIFALAGTSFGLAACVRQNLLVAAVVASLYQFLWAATGRGRWGRVVGFIAALVAVPAAYYAAEERVTGGAMSRAVFLLPSKLSQISPNSWPDAMDIFFEMAKLGSGLLMLALATFIAGPRRAIVGTRLDLALWGLAVAEAAAVVPMCLRSNGAWVNYAQPAVVWGSILAARAALRVIASPALSLRAVAIWVAAFFVMGNDLRLAEVSRSNRRDGRSLLASILDDPEVRSASRSGVYFVSHPQFNRMFGRSSLAHDEWLYSSFEALHMAEPRTRWLAEALAGPVTVVVVPSSGERDDFVSGLDATLPELHYRRASSHGPYSAWVRSASREEGEARRTDPMRLPIRP